MNDLIKEMKVDQLQIKIYETNEKMGEAAAMEAADYIKAAIKSKNIANVMLATGNSQLSFLKKLRQIEDIYWPAVNIFHMDEYLDLPFEHPAAFSAYLKKNFLNYANVCSFFPVPGYPQNAELACRAYEYLIKSHPLDVCCAGIGENGHLAFNEPSVADFEDPVWVKVIKLEEKSRQQQINEGHFTTLKDVPTHAITVTIPGLLSAKKILCMVPEKRKADAVYSTLNQPISPAFPASILRKTEHAELFLDKDSASRIISS
ncbi:MAG: 6-phosphogluconolactonase [Actinomycetota bacterium]